MDGRRADPRALNLPAGAYILNAILTANNNATTTQTVSCRSIGLGPQLDQDREMVALTGSLSSSAPLTMTLRCTASSTEGSFLDVNYTAVKVATLTETA